MNSTQTYSSMVKAMSVAMLISSPYAVAGTRAMEVTSTNTFSGTLISGRITGKQVKIDTASQRYLVTRATNTLAPDAFPIPRTEMGRKLLEYRRAALAKGMKILSVDEINAMVAEGRGVSA